MNPQSFWIDGQRFRHHVTNLEPQTQGYLNSIKIPDQTISRSHSTDISNQHGFKRIPCVETGVWRATCRGRRTVKRRPSVHLLTTLFRPIYTLDEGLLG